jgi:rubrerythrin
MIEGKVADVQPEQVLALKDEIMALYNRELFERTYYHKQLLRFDGKIFDIIKWLMSEEEKHVNLLRLVLNRAGINAPDEVKGIPEPPRDTIEVIKTDIEFEEATTGMYNHTLKDLEPLVEKADGVLKEILSHIRDEELYHIEILREYLKEAED